MAAEMLAGSATTCRAAVLGCVTASGVMAGP